MLIWNVLSLVVVTVVCLIHFKQMFKFAGLYRQYRARKGSLHPRQSFAELMEFAKSYYEFSPSMQERVKAINDVFLRESVTSFLHGGIVGHELLRTLRQKADQKFENDIAVLHDIQFGVRTLPAVGWAVAIGSTIWMFNTGGEAITFERAASAFSVTMAAVFYGLTITYLIVMPLMEKVWRGAREERSKNTLLVEALGHMMRKKSPFELYETIQVLIPDSLRPQWTTVFAEKLSGKAG